MNKLRVCLTTLAVAAIILSPIPLLFNVISPVDAANRDSRIDAYRRSLDICIRCTQPGPPGPPGPQGPPGLPGGTTSQDLMHVVWQSESNLGPDENNFLIWDILYRKSNEGFEQSTINLSNNMGGNRPSIAVSGNNIHVVWDSGGVETSDILYRRSTDGGATFSDIVNLSNTPGHSRSPVVAVLGDHIHIMWVDGTPGNADVFYRRSTDGGATFGDIVNLSNTPEGSTPRFAVSGSNVYLIWQEDFPGPDEIFYRRSVDGGATFGPTENLSNNSGGSEDPAIAVFDNSVYVVWRDTTPGNFEIVYRFSNDGGSTFEPTENLSNNSGRSQAPAIAVSDDKVHIVWRDFTDSIPDGSNTVYSDILYRHSANGGATFDSTINLSDNTGDSIAPSISSAGDNVYVTWSDNSPEGLSGNYDILFRRSADGGSTFGSTTNLSTDLGYSISPKIAVNNLP